MRAVADVDLSAIAENLTAIRSVSTPALTMAVVKANGYGHGAIPVAQRAREVGVEWLGTAFPAEALSLRMAGDTGRILTWLWIPGDVDALEAVMADIDIGVSSLDHLRFLVNHAPKRARIQLKIDTGLGRSGAPAHQWMDVVHEARRAQDAGRIEITGVWSHLANGELAEDESVLAQQRLFDQACSALEGLDVIRHLANSGATFANPALHYELIRTGIAMYGLSPGAGDPPVRPAMTLRAQVAMVKRVPTGHGVSYGLTWRAPRDTTLALIPIGYGDGLPRSLVGDVWVNGGLFPIVGRVAMDQFVVDVGDAFVRIGDDAVVFGDPRHGYPSADDVAARNNTIGYELVTQINNRVPRSYS